MIRNRKLHMAGTRPSERVQRENQIPRPDLTRRNRNTVSDLLIGVIAQLHASLAPRPLSQPRAVKCVGASRTPHIRSAQLAQRRFGRPLPRLTGNISRTAAAPI